MSELTGNIADAAPLFSPAEFFSSFKQAIGVQEAAKSLFLASLLAEPAANLHSGYLRIPFPEIDVSYINDQDIYAQAKELERKALGEAEFLRVMYAGQNVGATALHKKFPEIETYSITLIRGGAGGSKRKYTLWQRPVVHGKILDVSPAANRLLLTDPNNTKGAKKQRFHRIKVLDRMSGEPTFAITFHPEAH